MSENFYTEAELVNVGTDIVILGILLREAGYTEVVTSSFQETGSEISYSLSVAETVTKGDMLTAIEAETLYSLVLDRPFAAVKGDGVASISVEVRDTRGAGASGSKVKAYVEAVASPFPISAEELTLDGDGKATLIIGPSPISGWSSNRHKVWLERLDGCALSTYISAQYTAPGSKAALAAAGADANGGVFYEAQTSGTASNSITVAHAIGATGVGNEDRALACTVVGDAITVTFGTDSNGDSVTPTGAEVVQVVNENADAYVKVRVGGTGTGLGNTSTMVATNLSGGTAS